MASRSFEAQYEGTCASCHLEIIPGQEVRYDDDDQLVHSRHASKPRKPDVICDRCFLTKPCECDD